MAKNLPPESPAGMRKGRTSMRTPGGPSRPGSGPTMPIRSSKNAPPESPAGMRKGHPAMKVAANEQAKHSGAPPKGYGSNGMLSAGSKRTMGRR